MASHLDLTFRRPAASAWYDDDLAGATRPPDDARDERTGYEDRVDPTGGPRAMMRVQRLDGLGVEVQPVRSASVDQRWQR